MIPKEVIYKIIEAGIAAPSGDNVQPWRFRWDGDNSIDIDIDIDIDKSPFNISYCGQKLASLMAAGAALENMRIMSAGLGYGSKVVYFPDAAQAKNCVARIVLQQEETVKDSSSLSSWIFERCVNRRFYDGRRIDEGLKNSILERTDEYNGLRCYWLQDRNRIKKTADLIRIADQMMFENQEVMAAVTASIRWTKKEAEQRRDGMPIESLELGWFESRGFHLFSFWHLVKALNCLGLSRFASLHSAKLTESSSALCLFTTQGDNLESYLRGGQLLERVWLKASSLGIAVQPMAGAAFLIARLKLVQGEGLSLRHRAKIHYLQDSLYPLFGLNEHEIPLMLLRLGYASAPTARALRQKVESLANL